MKNSAAKIGPFPSVVHKVIAFVNRTPNWDGNTKQPSPDRLLRLDKFPCHRRTQSSFPCGTNAIMSLVFNVHCKFEEKKASRNKRKYKINNRVCSTDKELCKLL